MSKSNHPRTSYVSLDATTEALLLACPEPAFILGRSGDILAANDDAAKMLGQSSCEDIVNHPLTDFLPPEVVESRTNRILKASQNRRISKFEEDVNGRSYVHTVVPIDSDMDGKVRMAVCSQDMTAIRQTDEDLRREQQRQIFFMESLPGLVFHIYPDETIRYANRYFRKLFGSPKGVSCRELINCNGDDCTLCPPKDAMAHDKALEVDWTAPNGRTFHIQYSPMTDSAGDRMVMALGIDITARKAAEDGLLKARDELEDRVRIRTGELERANTQLRSKSINLVKAKKKADDAAQAKSKFLANMSHEVRTPLNAIIGMTELALGTGNDDKRQEYLDNVLEASTSLLSVLNDILDFSKIEADKLTLESLDFNLRKVVSGAVEMHRPGIQEKDISLSFSISDNVPECLRGDPSRLRQVLVNLLGNAVKFTSSGAITVRVELAGGRKPKDGKHRLRFSVSDTGIGIPKGKQQAIFESFLQADDSITRKHGGTGLGLAICRLLVELMHGRMHVKSVEGEGSTFSFSAEFDPAEKAEAVEAETPMPEIPKLNILLADDNRLNRQLAATVLRERGHDVTPVENGQEVLDLLRAAKFDLVLMDVQMPVMDGISATRAIRTKGSGVLDPEIPIVAITAHALKGDRERFLEAGMNGYVSKPIRIRDLMQVIGETFRIPEDSASPTTADASGMFDREQALELLDGRLDLLSMMDGIFLRDAPKDMETLKAALAERDMNTAKRSAHSIKGSARTVGAVKVGSTAEQLEYQCSKREHSAALATLEILTEELNTVLELLSAQQDNGQQHDGGNA